MIKYSSKIPVVMMCAAFLLWVYAFRGFLLDQFALTGDACSYYEHFKYYIQNIERGVYPMWESSRSVPGEFFMRRIGEFNPLYLVILVMYKLGVAYNISYLFFLSGYYFLGAIGFYCLSEKIFHNIYLSFIAFLLLLFSSLGTMLFVSFIILIFTPMVWFFNFLVGFTQSQKKHHFLGMVFTLMILATTYIPFYFLTIFIIFALVFCILYFHKLQRGGHTLFVFLKAHKCFVGGCLLVLALSCVPSMLFFQEMGQGEIVLPSRHYNADANHMLATAKQRTEFGGVVPHMVSKEIIKGASNMHLGRIYFPYFIYAFLVLGFFIPINRRLIFIFCFGFSFFIVSIYDAAVYQFLYEHIPFFKYFRNFQFFFWWITIPSIILLAVEQGRIFFETKASIPWIRNLSQSIRRWHNREFFILLFLLCLITFQPLKIYHYLNQSDVVKRGHCRYSNVTPFFHLSLENEKPKKFVTQADLVVKNKPETYIGTYWFNFLKMHLNKKLFDHYVGSKILVYDNVEPMVFEKNTDHMEERLERIAESFAKNQNLAFVHGAYDAGEFDTERKENYLSEFTEVYHVTKDSPDVQVISSDVNFVKLKTKFSQAKFLVYNDAYHSNWQAFIQGKKVKLYRANVAFKGLWVPSGEAEIYFRFGAPWQYALKYFLFMVFNGTFGFFIFLWIKDSICNKRMGCR